MYLPDVRFFRSSIQGFPEINCEQKRRRSSENSQPSEDDPGQSHAFAFPAKRIPSNLAKRQIAEDDGGDGARAEREDGADETANG